MKVVLEERLQSYMKEKDLHNIVVETVTCKSWSGSYVDISARFADSEEAQEVKAKKYEQVSTDIGEVLVAPGFVSAPTVKLGLSHFLWHKMITVDGLHVGW